MKIEIDLPEALEPYLARLETIGLHGETIEDVAVTLIRDAVLKCISGGLIPVDPDKRNSELPAASLHAGDGTPPTDEQERDHAIKSSHGADLADASSLPLLTAPQARLFRSLSEAGSRYLSTAEMAEASDIAIGSVGGALVALAKKGYAENRGEPGLPQWVAIAAGEPGLMPLDGRTPPAVPERTRKTPFRRFTDVKELRPEAVERLPATHPAMAEGRTRFPGKVVPPHAEDRILKSGGNSRKTGDKVVKGPWSGMPIFTLTLEERATCPTSCHVYDACYGNAMQWPNRFQHGPELIEFLRTELADLQDEHPDGFVVRLHVLGDFWSVDYVAAWAGFLRSYPALRVFGYTAWPRNTEIGAAIKRITDTQWSRFAIRFSDAEPKPQGATTIFRKPEDDTVEEGIVCPAQTGKTECCGTCGLCWSEAAKDKTIVFIAHGRKLGPREIAPGADEPSETSEATPAVRPSPSNISKEDLAREHAKAFPVRPAPARPQISEAAVRLAEQRKETQVRPAAAPAGPNDAALRVEVGRYLREKGVTVKVLKGDLFDARGKERTFAQLIELANELRDEDGLQPFKIGEAA